jgi:hypothetical protein
MPRSAGKVKKHCLCCFSDRGAFFLSGWIGTNKYAGLWKSLIALPAVAVLEWLAGAGWLQEGRRTITGGGINTGWHRCDICHLSTSMVACITQWMPFFAWCDGGQFSLKRAAAIVPRKQLCGVFI